MPLPRLRAGVHELELTIPFTRKTDLEWCYLLGDFGVELRGTVARIIAAPRELGFGDWTSQGLPFYAGNVTYHCRFESHGGEMAIHVPRFKAPLLSLALDGVFAGRIAFAPFRLELGRLEPGEHTLEITAFGNRNNAFGPLHNVDGDSPGQMPDTWRSKGELWTYGYEVKPMGILSAPSVSLLRHDVEHGGSHGPA